MAVKIGIIFCVLFLGCLAVPVPENDLSIYFPESRGARIVGGTAAAEGAHPWMVAMITGTLLRSFRCGGSILSQRTVLTAAHCIDAVRLINTLNSSLRLTVGTNRWSQGGSSLAVSGFVMHPQYSSSTIKNDIGTLYTATDIVFSNTILPISLTFDSIGQGVPARVAGWGAIRAQGPAQAQLLEIQVETIDGNRCVNDVIQSGINLNMRPPPVDPAIELCTFHGPGRGTCQGDSGSALVRIAGGQQIGVVSWGFPCALGAPDMFVRVSAYQAWINQNLR